MKPSLNSSLRQIKRELSQCSPEIAILYATSCAEKLFPGLEAVSKKGNSGFHLAIRSQLDRFWINYPAFDIGFVDNEYGKCFAYWEDEELIRLSYEVDAFGFGKETISAMLAGLEAYRNGKMSEAGEAGYAVYCILDAYLVEKNEIDISDQNAVRNVEQDPMVIHEFDRQMEDIQALRRAATEVETLEKESRIVKMRAQEEGARLLGEFKKFLI